MSQRVGFLGPEGSFSHEATLTLGAQDSVAYRSLADLLAAVRDGEITQALVPLENALEGTVAATIDGLVFDHDLYIVHELILPISLHLLAKPGVTVDEITSVRSYVHALGQVRTYLASRGLATVETGSTSQAAREVSESSEKWAAVGSLLAGQIFGLDSIADDIADHGANATKFVLVEKGRVAPPTGQDRTSIVCFQDADKPGSLFGILGRFAARDINLTRLESRPTKQGLGNYCFVIEFEGHIGDDVVSDCLMDLQAHLARVKFLGSYPVTGEQSQERRGDVEQARLRADQWVSQIKSLIS
jgi:prephenate dehydratase